MLDNNKCILVYGLSNLELEQMKILKYKIIEITPEMCQMTIKDILNGLQLTTLNVTPIKEKAIIYNNFSEKETKDAIKATRDVVKSGVLAIVTPTSINWDVDYLINHLIEEREWYLKNRKE